MARLTWSNFGERFYEVGVDRGVLYISGLGVSWSGLASVTESPSGGDAKPYYLDGIKIQNISSAEEFEATIEAFNAPAEFGPCDGTTSIQNGLFATQQPRRPFSLSYRTMIGNDVEGSEHAYKIHLVYNALAAPSGRTNASLGGSVDPVKASWSITTLPPAITAYKPTAHFIIDSRFTSSDLLATVEDMLYGNDAAGPTLPAAQDLITMFTT